MLFFYRSGQSRCSKLTLIYHIFDNYVTAYPQLAYSASSLAKRRLRIERYVIVPRTVAIKKTNALLPGPVLTNTVGAGAVGVTGATGVTILNVTDAWQVD